VSEIGLAFYLVFGGNLLLEWGLSEYKTMDRYRNLQNAVKLIVISVLSTLVTGLFFRLVLTPLGLETLMPVFFAMTLFGLHSILNLLARLKGSSGIPLTGFSDGILPFSLVLYAAAMSTTRVVGSPSLLLLGGFAAALGYLAAAILLDDIVDRLNLEPVPVAFRGSPIRFMSAGLIALTFTGIEAAFLITIS
jgi:Na+-translocating ferredoxin:NAD+ oxidoreductase subunit A